jgi:hypothetical protein
MAFDLSQEYKVINLIGSTVVTADLNGVGVDLEQYEFDAVAIANVGLITSTAATYVINIQGSTASAGTYTTLASFNSLSGTAFSYDLATLDVNITDKTDNKFIRAQVDTTANGGTVSAIIGVNLLVKPVTAQADLNSATFA